MAIGIVNGICWVAGRQIARSSLAVCGIISIGYYGEMAELMNDRPLLKPRRATNEGQLSFSQLRISDTTAPCSKLLTIFESVPVAGALQKAPHVYIV